MGTVDGIALSNLPMVDSFFPRLQQCRKERSLFCARTLHMQVCLYGLDNCVALGNDFIPTFAECGSTPLAHQAFLGLHYRSEYAWSALIQAYVDRGDLVKPLHLYEQMVAFGTCPNKFTYSLMLKACSKTRKIAHGQKVHMEILKQGLQIDSFVGNSLVDMYAKCGSLPRSREIFDGLPIQNVVTWNSLITGYEENGSPIQALQLFHTMKEMGIVPDDVTSICTLKACASLCFIQLGQQVHSEVVQEGFELDSFVGSILITMYCNCGWVAEAEEVFGEMHNRDIVVWTSLIGGYAKNGLIDDLKKCLEQLQSIGIPFTKVVFNSTIAGYAEQGEVEEALLLYSQMKEQGILPDEVTFTCILKACSETAAIGTGRTIHSQIQGTKRLTSRENIVLNALINMYNKCGSMDEAQNVFDIVIPKDLITWSTLTTGYAAQGEFDMVLGLTRKLKEEGFQPDGFVCLSLIAVCSHAGLVERGQTYFEDLWKRHNVEVNLAHYNCVFDSFVRAGQLAEAVMMVKKFPFQPDDVSWSLFCGACESLGNNKVASS